jgi:hypothetical protein
MTDQPIADQTPEDYRHHFDRSSRRALRKMAEACGIDWQRPEYAEPQKLWEAVAEHIAGGVPNTRTVYVDDPFALFVTFRCHNHRETWEQTLVAKSRTLAPIDEEEGRRIIAQFMGSDASNCEQCGLPLTEYTSSMTRMSVFADQERQRRPKKVRQPL